MLDVGRTRPEMKLYICTVYVQEGQDWLIDEKSCIVQRSVAAVHFIS